MDTAWLSAAIGASSALLASGLTGFISLRLLRVQQQDRQLGELVAALAAFGYAVERLALHVHQTSPAPERASSTVAAGHSRARPSSWLIDRLSRNLFPRSTVTAINDLLAAGTRLSLIAPIELLIVVERIFNLLSQFEGRDEDWEQEWTEARGQLLVSSRHALGISTTAESS